MFTHIRRHQKWLWIVISAFVIISFVWYFNPNQQYGQGGLPAGDGVVGTIYGEPISTREFAAAEAESLIHHLVTYGDLPQSGEMRRQLEMSMARETRNRLLLLRKLEEYNIEVSDKATAEWIRQAFQDRDTKVFQQETYQNFLAALPRYQIPSTREVVTKADFERYARHRVGIEHLAAIAGTPGKLITPQEAAYQYRQEHQKVDAKVILLNSSNYLSAVDMSTNALGQFYTNRASIYRDPEKVQLSYVAFPISNYLAVAEEKLTAQTNLNQRIDMLYAQRGANFYTDENDQPMSPEAAKAKIREEAKQDLAQLEARRDAANFAIALEEAIQKNPPQPASPNPAETFEKVATDKGLNVQTTEPFTQFQGPPNMNVPEQFSRLAFQLTPEEPVVLQPIVGEDAVYVVAFKQRVPSRLQPLEDIRARVTDEYTRSESYRLARSAGTNLVAKLNNALATGGSFEAAAQEVGFEVIDLQPFARDARFITGLPPQVDGSTIAREAFSTAPGEVSDFITTREGGAILLVEDYIPVSDQEVQEALPEYLSELRRRNAGQAFDDWFRKEMERAKLSLAMDQEQAG